MDTPGYDPLSTTGQLATHTTLFRDMGMDMGMDMDFNAGDVVDGTLSETHGLGDKEFVPWQSAR